MKIRTVLGAGALVVATACITTSVVSQDKPELPPGMPEMTPEQMAEFQKWMEFATPGEHHQVLAKRVGKWNGVVKHWMDPAAPPETMNATAETKAIYDGRYFVESVEGEGMMPGESFLGKSITGYDNLKKKYIWMWIDNMGTGFMNAEGTFDPATKTFSFTFEYPDPMKGKYVKGRSSDRWVDENTFVSEMWGADRTGKEYRMMEITYTRAK